MLITSLLCVETTRLSFFYSFKEKISKTATEMPTKTSDKKEQKVKENGVNGGKESDIESEKENGVNYGKLMAEAHKIEEEFKLNGEEIVKDKKDGYQQRKDTSFFFWGSLVLIAIFAAGLAIYVNMLYSVPQRKSVFVSKDSFKQNLNDLRAKFTSQSPYLWKSVSKLGVDHIDEVTNGNAKRPLVFLLVSSKQNENVLSCMANKIAMSFSHNGQKNQMPVLMNGNDIANTAHSKESLDEKLGKELERNKGVVVITKIGALSYETASIFFKYCDNEGAPHPNAVFIFTLTLSGDEDLSKANKEIKSATRRHLRSVVWKDGDSASADALIARIVDPSPIPVLSEGESVLNSCPELH